MSADLCQGQRAPIWLFDLDNTLHDASKAVFWRLNRSMTDYIVQHLGLARDDADRLRKYLARFDLDWQQLKQK